MDEGQYTALAAALAAVPDPRQRRGQRYPWSLLLVLVGAALVSGQRHGRGIGQWVREHAEELGTCLGRAPDRLPSEATLRRAVRAVDPVALEQRLSHFATTLPRPDPLPGELHGQALDGKEVRGSRAHGHIVHVVGLVRHDGIVLAQTQVRDKSNEITAVPGLLAGRDLRGTVTTMDAHLAQRAIAQQILDQGGHYLMVVKDNQPTTAAAISTLFDTPPWLAHERDAEYWVACTTEKGHGRLETRTLEASTALCGWLDWSGAGQVLRRTCRRVCLATGEVSEEVSQAVTSLPPTLAAAARLERFWRGHWTIENRVHYVRDVTFGEDAGQAYRGHTARALAALRNARVNVLRVAGWPRMADAVRHYGAAVERALRLIGVQPLRL